jgi:cytochrome c553
MPSGATASLLSRWLNEGVRIAVAAAALLLASPAPAQDEFAAVREVLQTCSACHGDGGASQLPENPILAGQQYYYLYLQLKDFKSGARQSDIMGPLVQPLQPEQMKLLAQFFSKQKWPAIGHAAENASVEIARRAEDSGECISCHLGDLRGNSAVPRLAGQHPEYLKRTMLDFKNKVRTNAPAMVALFGTFSEQEIAGLADYLASLTVYQSSQGSEIQ